MERRLSGLAASTGLAFGPVDQVLVPDLLGEGPGLGHGSSLSSRGATAVARRGRSSAARSSS